MKEEAEEFRIAAHRAVDWIADYLTDPRKYRVLPEIKPGELVDGLPAEAPETGVPLEKLVQDFERRILPAVTHWNHPRFMAYFACTSSPPGILGELIAAALDTNGIQWIASPAVSELEQVTLAWLRRWLAMPEDWFGIIFDTASTSSMHAMVAAREFADPGSHASGGSRHLTVYASDQAHSSIQKAVVTAGLGQQNFRKVPSDAGFRMIPDALRTLIERDVAAGKKPCAIVATIGTTSSASIDPLPEIVQVARQHGVWVHVDAAYAGSAAILPEFRHILSGIEQADSLVLNPHKWMLVPVDLSAFYTRRPDVLRRAFSLVPEYLAGTGDPRAVSFMEYGIPLGRRFRALKLWFVMSYYGREGVSALLRDHIRWAKELSAKVSAHPDFEIAAPTLFSVVCLRLRHSNEANLELFEALNASGEVFLSKTLLAGQVVLRVAIGNAGTTQQDVEVVWALIQRKAAAILCKQA
jgi:aromatic-L-amino-acid decarboxylase